MIKFKYRPEQPRMPRKKGSFISPAFNYPVPGIPINIKAKFNGALWDIFYLDHNGKVIESDMEPNFGQVRLNMGQYIKKAHELAA